MPRLCGVYDHPPTEGRKCDRWKAKESNNRTGGRLREGQLLAVAKEEGKELGKEHLTQIPAAGGQGDVPVTASPTGDVPGFKERGVCEWWFLADYPAADPRPLEEVRQAAMASRKFQLPFQSLTSGNPVTTVNRAVGIQVRMEVSQERLADGGEDRSGNGQLVTQPTSLSKETPKPKYEVY